MLGKIKLGISIGDPNGIGIEIILKFLKTEGYLNFTPVIFAPLGCLKTKKIILTLTVV